MNTSPLSRELLAVIRARSVDEVVAAVERALSQCGAALSIVRMDPPVGFACYTAADARPDAAFEAMAGLPAGTLDRERIASTAVCLSGDETAPFALVLLDRDEITAGQRADLQHFAALAAVALANAMAFEASARQAQDVQTREALRFSLDSGQIGDWDLDLIHDTSRRSLRHDLCFGYETPIPEAEWGAAQFLAHVHRDDRAGVESGMREAIALGKEWAVEFRVIWRDGSLHWLAARGCVFRTVVGSASRMLGVVMDISERKQAEEALGASRQLAMGQVNALSRTLDALAAEPSPERLAEHVLRTMAAHLGAQSCSVWRREEDTGLYAYECSLEDGRIVLNGDPVLAGVQQRVSMHEFWPDAATMTSAEPSIMEDIHKDLNDHVAWRKRLLALGVVTVLMLPMMIGGRLYGTVSIRFARRREFQPAEIELAKALANQTMLALRLNQLSVQARAAAVTEERNRLARDIHDTLAQGFTGVIIQLEAASDATSKGMAAEAQVHVDRAQRLARESLSEARRSVRALRPRELEDKELGEALEALLAKMTAGTGLATDFCLRGEPRLLPPGWDENLLRIVQEAATNALRHASASRLEVHAMFEPELFALRIADNGRGFDRKLRHEGFGLQGIGERVELMGGSFNLLARPGEGVAMRIALPFPAESQ